MRVEYIIAAHGDRYPEDAKPLREREFGPRFAHATGKELLEEAARDHFYRSSGWESTWPLNFAIYVDGDAHCAGDVEADYTPIFTAKEAS